MTAASDAQTCHTCGVLYRARDAGYLGCRAHIVIVDPQTDHYACCGAAPADSACRTHADASHARPNGCHRIDHCATPEDRAAILTQRPFAIAPLDQAIGTMPHAAEDNGVTVFHFTKEEHLDIKDFEVRVPPNWCGVGVTPDGTLPVDLRAEHAELRQKLIEREIAKGSLREDLEAAADDPYATEWIRHTAGVDEYATPNFVPFAVILRIHPHASRMPPKGACRWID